MAATPEALALSTAQPAAPYGKLRPGPGRSESDVAAHQCARIHSAMVELVAKQGYDGVTLRELVRRAKVSTRAFYKHFKDKKDCFLRAYELVVQRTARRIVASQAGERDWQERLHLAFDAFARELEREPQAARLALVEAYAAGPQALERIRRAECSFEALVGESFASAPGEIEMPPLVVEGIVTGVARVSRAQLVADREAELSGLGDSLLAWALSYRCGAVDDLAELDRRALAANFMIEPLPPTWPESGDAKVPMDDRTLILAAVAKLAMSDGYESLTVPRIHTAAGVGRRSFKSHFSDVEACFLAALELRAGEAIAQAAKAQVTGRSWEGGVYQVIASLCAQIAQDPLLARLCFFDILAPGAGGMHCRERLVAEIVALLRDTAPPSQRLDDFTIEASIGAVWGIIHHHVVSGRAQHLPGIVATLSFLALAPATDGPAATQAIREEQVA